ncbi:hypothetical protein K7432_009553 [Basidiobolus ranarum]|uniref:G-protein coupled receptors family 1 profile domain-containing protein n=1 Tax=Basidiobolus ranarum TaxID=34480 RepID=A0ABR2WQA4_9FUNG
MLSATNKVPITLCALSAFASLTVLVCIVGVYVYRRSLADRVSFRLTALVALADLLAHLSDISAYLSNNRKSYAIATSLNLSFLLLSFLYTLMITLNLQIVLIHNRRSVSRLEWIYIVVPAIISFTFLLLAWVYLPFYINNVDYYPLDFLTIGIVALCPLTILYSIVVSSILGWKLTKVRKQVALSSGAKASTTSGSFSSKTVQRAVIRILLYPVSLIVVGIPLTTFLLMRIFKSLQDAQQWALVFDYTKALLGLFNGLPFIFDPTLYVCFQAIRKDWTDRYEAESGSSTLASGSLRRWVIKTVIINPQKNQTVGENSSQGRCSSNSEDKEIIRLL